MKLSERGTGVPELAKHMLIDYVEKKLLIDGADFPYYVRDDGEDLDIEASPGEMLVVYLPVQVDQTITITTEQGTKVIESPWFGQ